MKRPGLLPIVLTAGAAGLVVALQTTGQRITGPIDVRFDPAMVEFESPRFQGEPLEVTLQLVNRSVSEVKVADWETSCGCMVVSSGRDKSTVPFVLASRACKPVELRVNTAGRFGPQVFSVTAVVAAHDGRRAEVNASIRANIIAALQVEPRIVTFHRAKPGVEVCAEIRLADTLPDPGAQVREVKPSNAKTMRVELKVEQGPSDLFGGQAEGRARGTIRLFYVPDGTDERVCESVFIIPQDEAYPPVTVPVYCEVATTPYRFVPRGLSVATTDGEKFSREIAFVEEAGVDHELEVSKYPPGFEVRVNPSIAGRRMIKIIGTTRALSDGPVDIEFAVNGEPVAYRIRGAPMN